MDVIEYVREHWDELVELYAMIVALASAIIKIIPPLPDGHWALPIVKFIARWVALNTPTPTDKERKTGRWN